MAFPGTDVHVSSPNRHGTYLLTWTTYGTWLPGHSKGFVSRAPVSDGGHILHNRVGVTFDRDMPSVMASARVRMKGERVVLATRHAEVCRDRLLDIADAHDLVLHVAAIMATHVHVLVYSRRHDGEKLLQLLKGNLSHALTRRFGNPRAPSWWTRHGSRRYLPDEFSQTSAMRYVLLQDRPLLSLRPDRAG